MPRESSSYDEESRSNGERHPGAGTLTTGDRPGHERQAPGLSSTRRLESLSDAAFSIIITLLVLEIARPAGTAGMLAQELVAGWPSYLAYSMAFIFVGIIWLNHHYLFEQIEMAGIALHWINLAIVGTTALIPFPTGVISEAFRGGNHADEATAVVLYAVIAGTMCLAWLPAFIYLYYHRELIKSATPDAVLAAQIVRPIVGIVLYAVAALVGLFVHPALSIGIFVAVVLYYAWTSQGIRGGYPNRGSLPRENLADGE